MGGYNPRLVRNDDRNSIRSRTRNNSKETDEVIAAKASEVP